MTKTAWIIGGSSGIGKATARYLQDDGYTIILSARNKADLQTAQKDMCAKTPVMLVPCDVTDLSSLKKAKSDILKQYQSIDLMVFLAGVYDPMGLKNYDHDQSLFTINVNLMGMFNVFETLRPEALDPNTPIHLAWTASVAGFRGLPNSGAYGATKAAMINFAEIQRIELEGFNTKVQVINPGFVETRLTDKNDFEMPMRITADAAGQFIQKGLRQSTFEILFPTTFGMIMKTLRILPNCLYFKLAKKLL